MRDDESTAAVSQYDPAVPFAPAVRNSKEFPLGALSSGHGPATAGAAVADEMDGAAAPPPAPTVSDEPAITSSFNIRSGAFKPYRRSREGPADVDMETEATVRKSQSLTPPDVHTPEVEMSTQEEADTRHQLDKEVGANTQTMYAKMRENEHKHRPAYSPQAPYVRYRRILVDWMAETSDELKLDCTTVHVACAYLDRLLLPATDASSGTSDIPTHLWQLVALTCLRVAGKFEEAEENVPSIDSFTKHLTTPIKLAPAQVREWEIYVLARLDYNMTMVTPMHCITYFNGRGVVFKDDSWNGRALIDKIPRYVQKYTEFFANLCMQDYVYQQFAPSLLAAAIVYSARHALSVAPLWRPELEELTGHRTEDAHQVFLKIWSLYSDTFPAHARRTSASPKSVTDFDDAESTTAVVGSTSS